MKKLMALLAAFLMASVCSAQSLDEIANKYYAANGIETLEKAQTLTMKGIISQMGMEMTITIMLKKPNKVKVIQELNGMEVIMVFDGEKGYMVNPLTGSTEPVEIPVDQLGSVKEYNVLKDSFMEAYMAGRLKLEGEEEVEGKPVYKMAVTSESGNTMITYLDKESFLPVKTQQTGNQMGMEMLAEAYVKERKEINGVKFGSRIAQFINGAELGEMTFETIEFDTPIDDSVFKL